MTRLRSFGFPRPALRHIPSRPARPMPDEDTLAKLMAEDARSGQRKAMAAKAPEHGERLAGPRNGSAAFKSVEALRSAGRPLTAAEIAVRTGQTSRIIASSLSLWVKRGLVTNAPANEGRRARKLWALAEWSA